MQFDLLDCFYINSFFSIFFSSLFFVASIRTNIFRYLGQLHFSILPDNTLERAGWSWKRNSRLNIDEEEDTPISRNSWCRIRKQLLMRDHLVKASSCCCCCLIILIFFLNLMFYSAWRRAILLLFAHRKWNLLVEGFIIFSFFVIGIIHIQVTFFSLSFPKVVVLNIVFLHFTCFVSEL